MINIKEYMPLKLTSERVWRTYLGGKLLSKFQGEEDVGDGHFPEEWVMSIVSAHNTGRENIVEGLSRLSDNPEIYLKNLITDNPKHFLGEKHIEKYGSHLGVLVKLLDSAERLSIQVHPSRQQAKKLFNSPYGKTECWHILEGRVVNGEKPCVYLGFKKGITKEHWVKLFHNQDISGMLKCLHKVEVNEGDTILIDGGVPHAIGAGCFLVEIQEPTDYTIRVERTTPSGFAISDAMCHQGLGFEEMFECFNYEGYSEEEVRRNWFVTQHKVDIQPGGKILSLLSYEDTPFFRLHLLEVYESLTMPSYPAFSGLYILEGKGNIVVDGEIIPIINGDQFFLSSKLKDFTINTTGNKDLKILHFFGPEL